MSDALQAFLQSCPYRSSGPATFWQAEAALDSQPEDIPLALVADYYACVQQRTPEVPPRLENRNQLAIRGWAEAARRRPDVVWNRVLLAYAGQDAQALAEAFRLLRAAWGAPANPELDPALRTASQDSKLVDCLEEHRGGTFVTPFPVGWAAILVRAGKLGVVDDLLRQGSDLNSWNELDDLRRLCPEAALPQLDARLSARDEATGQVALSRALGQEFPRLFSLSLCLPAKSGHSFRFSATRDWRSTAVWWDLSVGKAKSGFHQNANGIMSNKFDLPEADLGRLRDWLINLAPRLKTRWKGPLEVESDDDRLVASWKDYLAGLF